MRFSIFLIALLFANTVLAQEPGVVSGTVLDKEHGNEPMSFAHVALKNTSIKLRTNIFGNFEIAAIDPGTYVLVVTFAGYETQEIQVEVRPGDRTLVQAELFPKTLVMAALSPDVSDPNSRTGNPFDAAADALHQ